MRGPWDEGGAVELEWLPPATEWDFRSIREKESRLACCWEYARDCGVIHGNLTQWLDGPGGMTTLGEFICTHGMRFPTPWIMAGDEMPALAAGLEAESSPITVYSLQARKAFVLREVAEAMEDGRDVLEVLNRLLLADGYVMTLAFETAGSELANAHARLLRLLPKHRPDASQGRAARHRSLCARPGQFRWETPPTQRESVRRFLRRADSGKRWGRRHRLRLSPPRRPAPPRPRAPSPPYWAGTQDS